MGRKYTESQAKATANYMSGKHTIRVVVPKEDAERYKAAAKKEGKSLNRYIIDCIEERKNSHLHV